jgi:two-component system, chemotaxis family, protein-glutamate methylesterase/glutaminase
VDSASETETSAASTGETLESRFRGAEPEATPERPPIQGLAYRNIIVIGASAGGVEALRQLVSGFPPELAASLFVVLHLSPTGTSVLPSILERAGELPATVPTDRDVISRGHIYVAPPDQHMLLAGEQVRLTTGPRENGHRPAVDPLFRSAARTYDGRVVAVVLSGTLDDGAAGARLVKERGGMVLVQADPLHPDMPQHTAAATDVDGILPVNELTQKICEIVELPLDREDDEAMTEQRRRERDDAAGDAQPLDAEPAELACPECGGPLWEREEGPLVRFACRVGHVYSPESLVSEQGKELEKALWTALRGLEERADLYRRMARRAVEQPTMSTRFEERATGADSNAAAIREAIARLAAGTDLERAS